MQANARLYSCRLPSSESIELPAQARRGAGVARGELGIDQVAHGDGRMTAALPVQGHHAAAAVQGIRGVAGHASEPLRGLGSPDQALRRP